MLWHEHVDLGVVVDTVSYGFSPGDAAMPEPGYVGPHEGPPSDQPARERLLDVSTSPRGRPGDVPRP